MPRRRTLWIVCKPSRGPTHALLKPPATGRRISVRLQRPAEPGAPVYVLCRADAEDLVLAASLEPGELEPIRARLGASYVIHTIAVGEGEDA